MKREYAEQYLFPPKRMQLTIGDSALHYCLKFTEYSHISTPYWILYDESYFLELLKVADCVMVMNARAFAPMIKSKFAPVLHHLAISKHPYVECHILIMSSKKE